MAHFMACTKKIIAEETAQLFLSSVFRLHGIPKDLISDRDPCFTSDWWKAFTKTLQIHLNMSTAYHPQSDGQTERTNRTLEQMLRMYVRPDQDDWDTYLPLVEYAYNGAIHETTHQTLFEIIYDFTPPGPFIAATFYSSPNPQVNTRLQRARDLQNFVRRRLLGAATQQQQQQDPHRRELQFKVGEQVWLSSRHLSLVDSLSSKFRVRWVGPFSITRIINEVTYQLELPSSWRIHNVFHVSLVKPYVPPTSFPQRPPFRPPLILIDGEKEYLLVEIPEKRMVNGVRYFKVRWLGYDPNEDTWELLTHLQETAALDVWESTQLHKPFTPAALPRSARTRVPPLS